MNICSSLAIIVVVSGVLSLPVVAAQGTEQAAGDRGNVSIIHVGVLLAVPGEAPVHDRSIIIRGDRIDRVEKGFVTPEEIGAPDAVVHDFREVFVLPGLMDMHVHLSSTRNGQDEDDDARYLNDEQEALRAGSYALVEASLAARQTLAAGYTTVRDVGSAGWHIFALRDAINDGKAVGPRIFAAGSIIRIGTDGRSGTCYSVESCRRAVREQIDKGADLIKVAATCSGGQPCGHRDAPPVFLEDELRTVVEVAHSRELKVAAHAHGTAGINAALRAGVDSIEHGSFNDVESRRLMKMNGVFLVSTLSVEDSVKKSAETAEGPMLSVEKDFIAEHPKRMAEAAAAGVKIAAGSDAPFTPHGNNVRELEWYVDSGISEMDAIVAATVNGAALLGRESDNGTIESGKFADLVGVTGDPTKNISDLRRVVFVMRAGVLYSPHELLHGLTIDEGPDQDESDAASTRRTH